ncbi:uncharacterized protein ACA1_324940 [Acanthamoeba castellanii str. Neff]|uniref:Uncharacterized protein n=1 Tax=Acanthamoeba castellanii (strain ATCC 30010 / Neff) TaxID=1257118 RepID=L8GHH7_ACACF|nr:uncharacterized protein ACA1_324940 [Acanthamoeba castellanii str. Neff]ELR12447.1 hypothetical protein ACA1_324940 [Acanthamoeba castellanii str. Neff]
MKARALGFRLRLALVNSARGGVGRRLMVKHARQAGCKHRAGRRRAGLGADGPKVVGAQHGVAHGAEACLARGQKRSVALDREHLRRAARPVGGGPRAVVLVKGKAAGERRVVEGDETRVVEAVVGGHHVLDKRLVKRGRDLLVFEEPGRGGGARSGGLAKVVADVVAALGKLVDGRGLVAEAQAHQVPEGERTEPVQAQALPHGRHLLEQLVVAALLVDHERAVANGGQLARVRVNALLAQDEATHLAVGVLDALLEAGRQPGLEHESERAVHHLVAGRVQVVESGDELAHPLPRALLAHAHARIVDGRRHVAQRQEHGHQLAVELVGGLAEGAVLVLAAEGVHGPVAQLRARPEHDGAVDGRAHKGRLRRDAQRRAHVLVEQLVGLLVEVLEARAVLGKEAGPAAELVLERRVEHELDDDLVDGGVGKHAAVLLDRVVALRGRLALAQRAERDREVLEQAHEVVDVGLAGADEVPHVAGKLAGVERRKVAVAKGHLAWWRAGAVDVHVARGPVGLGRVGDEARHVAREVVLVERLVDVAAGRVGEALGAAKVAPLVLDGDDVELHVGAFVDHALELVAQLVLETAQLHDGDVLPADLAVGEQVDDVGEALVEPVVDVGKGNVGHGDTIAPDLGRDDAEPLVELGVAVHHVGDLQVAAGEGAVGLVVRVPKQHAPALVGQGLGDLDKALEDAAAADAREVARHRARRVDEQNGCRRHVGLNQE